MAIHLNEFKGYPFFEFLLYLLCERHIPFLYYRLCCINQKNFPILIVEVFQNISTLEIMC